MPTVSGGVSLSKIFNKMYKTSTKSSWPFVEELLSGLIN